MKQSKKLTRKQKILLDRMRMNTSDYHVIAEGKSAILLQNKHNGQVIRKIIPKVLKEKSPLLSQQERATSKKITALL